MAEQSGIAKKVTSQNSMTEGRGDILRSFDAMESEFLKNRGKRLIWLDREKSETTKYLFKKCKLENEELFQQYRVEYVDDLKDKECDDSVGNRHGLGSMLDYGLEGVNECMFNRVLVILIHNKDHGEIPKISTRAKIEYREQYKNLRNIIDVGLSMTKPGMKFETIFRGKCKMPYVETIFGEGTLEMFLKDGDHVDVEKTATCCIL